MKESQMTRSFLFQGLAEEKKLVQEAEKMYQGEISSAFLQNLTCYCFPFNAYVRFIEVIINQMLLFPS